MHMQPEECITEPQVPTEATNVLCPTKYKMYVKATGLHLIQTLHLFPSKYQKDPIHRQNFLGSRLYIVVFSTFLFVRSLCKLLLTHKLCTRMITAYKITLYVTENIAS